ncbi:Segment polarity protein dishevelled [Strongyloides ratti]|uniref:Segment polarity protein dishevelled n=1 Tax=Strongyloides ratti TaxID=34506 RepID=A0A090KXD2_STRRB|nr:Segment polarity protein dishevelled [Strongyloides ratti]CEF59917.1 Segment polarity protein dishevelled [Strongyloides ratti]
MVNKIYYYLDDNTPYVSEFDKPLDEITLGDFKRHFKRKGYRYFYKKEDDDIQKPVKVELFDDTTILCPSGKGPIELFLIPCTENEPMPIQDMSHATLTRKNVHRFSGYGSDYWKKSYKPHPDIQGTYLSSITDIDNSGGQRVSMVTTDYDTSIVYNKLGRKLPVDQYTTDSEFTFQSEDDDNYRKKRQHKGEYRERKPRQNKRKIKTESVVSPTLNTDHSFLGMKVVGNDGGIFVSDIDRGGAADFCENLEIGDQIIQIDNKSFEDLTEEEAVNLLKYCVKKKKNIKMYISKRKKSFGNDTTNFFGLDSTTLPIDISCWVETAIQRQMRGMDRTYIEKDIEDYNQTFQQENIPPSINDFSCINTSINDENSTSQLTCFMDPSIIIHRMIMPNNGIEIKDRVWLKITVPSCIIGKDLVCWLKKNVRGLENKKKSYSYAAWLLHQGHIRHMIGQRKFTEQSYYIFNEYYAKRIDINEMIKSKNESNTDITYCRTSSSNTQGKNENDFKNCHSRNNFSSAITNTSDSKEKTINSSNSETKKLGKCSTEIPVNNDYASMLDMDETDNTFHDNLYQVVPDYKTNVDHIDKQQHLVSSSYEGTKFKV